MPPTIEYRRRWADRCVPGHALGVRKITNDSDMQISVRGPYVLLFCDAGPIIGAEGRCGQSLDIEEIALRAVSPGAPSLGTHHAVALLMQIGRASCRERV